MKHRLEKHEDCQVEYCPVCDGGLAICSVCRCIEGSLASECPGHDCWASHGERIYRGEIDFRDGQWVNAPAR